MTFALSDQDLEIQQRARTLVDEIIPFEVEAEMNAGELKPDVREAHERRAHELGFTAINIPKEHGGDGYTMLQQVLIQEQTGRATNALGWVVHTPPGWLWQVATNAVRDQSRRRGSRKRAEDRKREQMPVATTPPVSDEELIRGARVR